jgi:hypothetical protein
MNYIPKIIVAVIGTALTRQVAKRLTAPIAPRAVKVELEAEAMIDEIEFEEDDVDEVLQEYTTDAAQAAVRMGESKYLRSPVRARRFVAAMVTVLRAEFGAPTDEYRNPVIRQATYLKLRTFLIKWCKDRHVREKDRSANVDDAVALWFVPTRRDIRRQRLLSSATVAGMRSQEERARSPIFTGLVHMALRAVGHKVGGAAEKPLLGM